MELNERLKNEIAAVFRKVKYGEITFHLNPEKKTLDCEIKVTEKIPVGNPGADYDLIQPGPILDKK